MQDANMNMGTGKQAVEIDLKISPAEAKRYVAEAVGAFILSIVVVLVSQSNLAVLTPMLAGLALGLGVYVIGSISGGHANPAVTLGALSIGRISVKDTIGYIVGQFVGALAALLLGAYFAHRTFSFAMIFTQNTSGVSTAVFLAEMIGTIIFTFGVASVLYGKVHHAASGIVVGSSLLIGAFVAAIAGALGLLNPAVAFSANSFNLVYGLAPIVGAVIGMNLYKILKS